MRILKIGLISSLVVFFAVSVAITDDATEQAAGENQPEMEMGPPQQIKDAAWIIGDWTFKGEMRWGPESPWEQFEATAKFSYVCGGAAIQMDWRMPSPSGEMIGLSLSAYDREKQEWQETWVDNWSGQLMMMTGHEKDGKRIMTGKAMSQGKQVHMRNTSWEMSDKTFKWQMESSMDGQSWYVSMKGEYTKM